MAGPKVARQQDLARLAGGKCLLDAGALHPGATDRVDERTRVTVLLNGNILQVVQDRRDVSFMHSYPNLVPLPPAVMRRIADTDARFAFDRLYGARWERVVPADVAAPVARSAARYIAALGASE